jgi:hypothetical protein
MEQQSRGAVEQWRRREEEKKRRRTVEQISGRMQNTEHRMQNADYKRDCFAPKGLAMTS